MRTILLAILLGLSASSVSAQSVAEVRSTLTSLHEKIQHHSPRFGDGDYDSLYVANDRLMQYLSSVLVTVPGTLSEDFSTVGLKVATSADRNLRVWSWDDETGGSMRYWNSIVQYRTHAGIKAELVNDTLDRSGGTPFCDTIYSIESEGRMYYLPLFRGKWSNQEGAQILEGWVIRRDSLFRDNGLFDHGGREDYLFYGERDRNLSDNGGKQRFNHIHLGYNLLTNIEKEHAIHIVGRSIRVPVTGDRDAITDRWAVYEFDGEWFTYKRTTK